MDNHHGVVTHLEPDCLECLLPQRAFLGTKLVEVMEFQLSYSKSWKMILWKCCTQYASKYGKLSSGHRTGKGQFLFQSQRKAVPKNAQTTAQLLSSPLQCSCLENPRDGEPGGLPSMGSHRVGHDWSGLAAAAQASEGDRIPVELFQILKDDSVKVLHSICQQIWKTQQWPQDWKRSIFIPIPKKGNAKEWSNYCTICTHLTL